MQSSLPARKVRWAVLECHLLTVLLDLSMFCEPCSTVYGSLNDSSSRRPDMRAKVRYVSFFLSSQ